MTKRLLCLCLLVLAAGRCGRTDVETKLNIALPPLPDGEVNQYRVRVVNDSIGILTATLHHDWLEPASEAEEPLPVFALVLVTRTMTGKVPTTDSSLLHVRRSDLAPRSSFRFIRTGSALSTTACNYGTGSVAVSSYASGEEKQRLLPTSARTYDIDELTLLGRALKLEPKKPASIAVINPMGPPLGGTMYAAEFRWAGDEEVTVPAGTFDCRKVQLLIGQGQIELWYEKAGTQRLVRYLAAGSGMVIDLLPPSAPILGTVPVSGPAEGK